MKECLFLTLLYINLDSAHRAIEGGDPHLVLQKLSFERRYLVEILTSDAGGRGVSGG